MARRAPSIRSSALFILVRSSMSRATISATRALHSGPVGSGVITFLHGLALPASWPPSACFGLVCFLYHVRPGRVDVLLLSWRRIYNPWESFRHQLLIREGHTWVPRLALDLGDLFEFPTIFKRLRSHIPSPHHLAIFSQITCSLVVSLFTFPSSILIEVFLESGAG